MHSLHAFTRSLVTARLEDETLRRRELVLNVLLVTTAAALLCTLLLLGVHYSLGDHSITRRFVSLGAATLLILGLYALSRKRRYRTAAIGLLALYMLLATGMAAHWGVNLPVSILLYGLAIILSGELLGARYSLYAFVVSGAIMVALQVATINGTIHPDVQWRTAKPYLNDVLAYFLVFGMLALSAWLFNRQMELALQQALRAEAALTRQKKLLEVKVEARTRDLQAAQLDKVQQVYRFAQLGQFSTSLLHDLANHITALGFDIERLEEERKPQFAREARRRLEYITDMVRWAYQHLNGTVKPKTFSVNHEIDEVIGMLQHKAQRAWVHLERESAGSGRISHYGDPNRFQQIIANLVSNAIDAYEEPDMSGNLSSEARKVIVKVHKNDGALHVSVHDWGKGIPKDLQATIFEPFYSTKHTGMGVGLFIVRQVVQEYFGGSIGVTSGKGQTIFSVTLRKARHENTGGK
ncbi:MAG TPA: HAMP domain-containing sensor histidine kinase [Candidatus Saccharimonadales bacterium]|nr:HAMP domain-containing sensor histidine kinase [Candidatus Saccharimonadales bacterium]